MVAFTGHLFRSPARLEQGLAQNSKAGTRVEVRETQLGRENVVTGQEPTEGNGQEGQGWQTGCEGNQAASGFH